jgi:cytochrome oxidase assembly protein ShyY1
MLLALSNAFASALRLPPDAVEVLGIQRRRLLADLTVALLIRAPIEPAQIASVDLDAVAQTSGLPITIQSLAVVLQGTAPATTPTPPPTTTDKTVPIALAAVGGVVGFALLVALVMLLYRPHRDGIVRRVFI